MNESYAKILTKNDTGETGGHQAGIVVPRQNESLISFFPVLDLDAFNPDCWISCRDPDGEIWTMRYVYYNGKTFSPPLSTRNEYRITHMTKFFSKWGAKSGDSVVFTSTNDAKIYEISIKGKESKAASSKTGVGSGPVVLKGWAAIY